MNLATAKLLQLMNYRKPNSAEPQAYGVDISHQLESLSIDDCRYIRIVKLVLKMLQNICVVIKTTTACVCRRAKDGPASATASELGIEAVEKNVQEFPQQPEPAYKPFLVRFMYKNGPTIVARHLPHLEGHTDDLRIMSRMLGDDIPGPEPGYNNQVRTEMWDDIDNPLYQKLWKQTD